MNPEKILLVIEKEIKKMNLGHRPKSLYEPIRYIMSLGGKRMRPLLTCLSYSIYRDDVEKIIPFAAAVEVFHNFTLMHDDIMDRAPLRRGKPTVHEKWNVNTAILSGDVMLVKAYDMFLSLPPAQLKEVFTLFNRTAAEVCEGQQLDMEFETSFNVTEAQYLEMIRLKTAVLLGFSLELGALLASAPDAERAALYDFGVNIGIGFQLKDDLLDVYGDQKKFGKLVGGDIVSNKKTFLLVKAIEKAGARDNAELMRLLSAKKKPDERKKIAAMTRLYDRLNIPVLTEQKIETFLSKAYKTMDLVSSPKKEVLFKFAQELVERYK